MHHFTLCAALLVAVLCSCREEKLTTPPAHFDKEVSLSVSRSIDLEELDVLKPRDITVNSEYVLIRDFGASEGRFCAMDMKTHKVCRGLKIGQGPDDVTSSARPFVCNDTLIVVDANQNKILFVDVEGDSLVVVGRKPFSARGGYGRCFLSGNKALMMTSFDSLFVKLTTLDGKIISSVGYPTEGVLSTYPYNLQNSIYLNSILAVSPDETWFSAANIDNGYYCFGTIDGDELKLKRQIIYPDSQVKIGGIGDYGHKVLLPERDSPSNVIDGFGTNSHVAYLFCGREIQKSTSAQTILVYDWEGNPVVALKTKEELWRICYDSTRNVIIGIAQTPEAIYVEYDLDGVLDL